MLKKVFLSLCFLAVSQYGHSKTSTWVFLGDSITAGYGIEQAFAFPNLLDQHLKKSGHKVNIINAGISGSTSASGLSRLKWALKSKPDLVMLELGANDALRGQDVKGIKKNLKKTIDFAIKNKVEIILIGIQIPANYGQAYRQNFAKIFPDLAKEYNIKLFPFIDQFFKDKSLVQADGIHPSRKGHQLIFSKIQPLLKDYLNDQPKKVKKLGKD